jgi:uncharacterized protein (DUF4415 family)
MKTEHSSPLNAEQYARLKRLSDLPDAAIDTSEIPEITDWTGAKRGLFYTGPADKVSVGLDPDVVAWFESKSANDEEPDSEINKALRAYMRNQIQKAV